MKTTNLREQAKQTKATTKKANYKRRSEDKKILRRYHAELDKEVSR